MDTVGRVSRIQGRDWVVERHLLGLGVLFVTVSAGYFLSGISGGREVRPLVQEARVETPPAESAPAASAPAASEAEGEGDLDTYIKQVAARYDVPADLVAAVIDAESSKNPRAVSRHGARVRAALVSLGGLRGRGGGRHGRRDPPVSPRSRSLPAPRQHRRQPAPSRQDHAADAPQRLARPRPGL